MKHLLSLLLLALLSIPASAQRLVERRDQAEGWYVPVNGRVTASGGNTRGLTLYVYKDNQLMATIKPKRGRFQLELDINNVYSFRVTKDGYQEKLVTVDTSLPEGLVEYPAYDCFMNLEPADKFTHSDPFYLDFPSAVVRWDPQQKGFYHSMNYLADIQTKMALLQAQAIPD